jgi:CRISPR-associated endonuclease/helicase Cas3
MRHRIPADFRDYVRRFRQRRNVEWETALWEWLEVERTERERGKYRIDESRQHVQPETGELRRMLIYIRPVHSLTGSRDPSSGLFFSYHQMKTQQALRDPTVQVVFNAALTGDGKSLAAYLPALQEGRPILAMYPTNELVRDQQRQVKAYQELFATSLRVETMFSERLYELRADLEIGSQQSAINWLTAQAEVVLTNPDIFNLIANFAYVAQHENPDALLQRVLERFDLFVFDEFHLYDAPQVNAVLTSLLYVLEQSRRLPVSLRKKFLFLSATPSPRLLEALRRAGVEPCIVQGAYDFSDTPPADYRTITQAVTLNCHAVGRQTAEWVEQNVGLICDWFTQHPGSRGAIIVNSVATAKRLIRFFEERRQEGEFPWIVAENTGLHRDDIMSADLIIGTSTVDVGVDFHINFLIFEALDAGQWIQRLGRLGRHRGYRKPDGTEVVFDAYTAHSLLPLYSYERLAERVGDGETVDRAWLFALVRGDEVEQGFFSPVNDFRTYGRCWGWLAAAHVLNALGHPRIRENYVSTRQNLTETYSAIFGLDVGERVKWHYALSQNQPELVKEVVERFRGETPFDCGILDDTEQDFNQQVKTYDLFWVLRHAEVAWLDRRDFLREVEQRGRSIQRFKHVDVCLRVREYLSEPRRLTLAQSRRRFYADWNETDFRKPHVLDGFTIDAASPVINRVNRWIERKPLLCLVTPYRIDELRARLRLPPLFPLYRVTDGDGDEFTVAFSKEALLLLSQPLIFAGVAPSTSKGNG